MCKTGNILKLKVIAAACENMGIGNKGAIPWRLKNEMKYFSDMTTTTKDPLKKNVVIMGRKTWESIPSKFKPLPNRINVVISKTIKAMEHENLFVFCSLDEALSKLGNASLSENIEDVWIIGGALLYEEAMNSPLCDSIYLTRIDGVFTCDTYFPKIPECFQVTLEDNVPTAVQEENGISYRYTVLKRKNEL